LALLPVSPDVGPEAVSGGLPRRVVIPLEVLERLYVTESRSLRAIARELGCSDSTVAKAVRRQGLVRPTAASAGRLDESVVRELVRLYADERLDLRQVAARTGVPRDRVAVELRAQGVRLRKRGSRPAERLDGASLRLVYEAGATLRQLALQEGTDDGAVPDALIGAGTVIRRHGSVSRWRQVLTADFLQEQYVEGSRSVRAIARFVGCHYETVRAAMRLHGISVRR
jgi:transposase-like protein